MVERQHPGGARSGDPITSLIAAFNLKAISHLEQQTLHALRYADKFPQGCMTSTDVALWLNRFNPRRDSYSPRMKRLNHKGYITYMGKRLCQNISGQMVPMIAFRLRRPDELTVVLAPEPTPVEKTLSRWAKLTPEERVEFARIVPADTLTAQIVILLMDGLDAVEGALLDRWIDEGD